jgi:tRNA(Ile)-lysidine synthase
MPRPAPGFSTSACLQAVLAILAKLPSPPSGLLIAYSGGRDSTVLLYALAQCREGLPLPLRAVHIDHGLQAAAAAWGDHCAEQCQGLGLPLQRLMVDARPRQGESPEAAAREARYAALRELVGEQECVLSAHHRDDQGETLMLQLLRGSGPRGLAAMPGHLPLGRGHLLRPLLGFTRAELAAWALEQGLDWIEDPSNQDQDLDRNFLRHQVLPLLESRWPAVERTLARAANHQQDSVELLDVLAAEDLARVGDGETGTLYAAGLAALSPARARNLLRYWLRRHGLRPPAAVVLERVLLELLPAAGDRNPVVHWHGGEVRRFRGRVYALRPQGLLTSPEERHWDLVRPLTFVGGLLNATRVRGRGLRASACTDGVWVGSRQGGEACRPLGQTHRRRLKELIRQAGIPPWERERLALVHIDGCLVQVVGLCIDGEWVAGPGEDGVLIELGPLQEKTPPAGSL